MTHYELVVIGAGPAGEKAAAQAAYFGKRVAIERPQPTTMAPRAAKSMASCRPIPLDAPVITITRFRKFIAKLSSRSFVLADSQSG